MNALSSAPRPARAAIPGGPQCLGWSLAATGFGILYAAHLLVILPVAVQNWGLDFHFYWDAATRIATGQDLYGYLEPVPSQAGQFWRMYIYPPLFALVLSPFALVLDYDAARRGWLAFSGLCLLGGLLLTYRLSGVSWQTRRPLLLLAALPLVPWTALALGVGQPSPQLLLILVAAYVGVAPRRPGRTGALLALGTCLRVLPAPLIGYLVLRRQWRACLVAAAVGVLLVALPIVVLGWEPTRTYLTVLPREQPLRLGLPNSASLASFFARLLVPNPYTTPVVAAAALASVATLASTAVVIAVTSYAIWRARADAAGELAAYALAVAATLAISPISLTYNLVLAALPLAVGVARVQALWPRYGGHLLAASVLLSLPAEPCDLWGVRSWCVSYLALGGGPLNELPLRMGWWNLAMLAPLCGLLALWWLMVRLCLDASPPRPSDAVAAPARLGQSADRPQGPPCRSVRRYTVAPGPSYIGS